MSELWLRLLCELGRLVGSLAEHGLYFTTCAPAAWYGCGFNGFFVMMFIYSKLPELVDTVLLALAGKPVIALQWWRSSEPRADLGAPFAS